MVLRVLGLSLAALCVVIGIVLVFVPGPAVLFFFVAAALLAEESRSVANALDRVELALRGGYQRARSGWGRASLWARAAWVAAAVAVLVAAAWMAWRVVW